MMDDIRQMLGAAFALDDAARTDFESFQARHAPLQTRSSDGELVYKEKDNALVPQQQQPQAAEPVFSETQTEALVHVIVEERKRMRRHVRREIKKLRSDLLRESDKVLTWPKRHTDVA